MCSRQYVTHAPHLLGGDPVDLCKLQQSVSYRTLLDTLLEALALRPPRSLAFEVLSKSMPERINHGIQKRNHVNELASAAALDMLY